MFWDAVIGGLSVFGYWQTYLATLEYVVLFMLPVAVLGLLAGVGTFGNRAGIGCLSAILLPLIQVAAQVIFVLTLWPIILGLGTDATWGLPFQLVTNAPAGFLKLVAVLAVAMAVLTFIPLLGRLNSLHTMFLGAVALVTVVGILDSTYPGTIPHEVHFWPGFWFAVGLVLVSAVLSSIGLIISGLVLAALEPWAEQWWVPLAMLPISAVLGFIPVFIYGAWIGGQLRGIQ